jgi:hypothetical protein
MRKLELLPEAFANFARRRFVSGLSRTLSATLRVFAMNTF